MAKLISIGIVENISVSSDSGINQDGRRVLSLEVALGEKAMVEAMMSGTVIEPMKSSFLHFDTSMTVFGKDDEFKTFDTLSTEFALEAKKLVTYGSFITSEEDAQAKFGTAKVFESMGIQESGIYAAMQNFVNEEFLISMYNKLYELFGEYTKAIPTISETKFRHKFWRASKNKAFASVPSMKTKGVFVEPMTVPIEDSEISWSVYELEKGKNDDTEIAADVPENVVDAGNMFEAPEGVGEVDLSNLI